MVDVCSPLSVGRLKSVFEKSIMAFVGRFGKPTGVRMAELETRPFRKGVAIPVCVQGVACWEVRQMDPASELACVGEHDGRVVVGSEPEIVVDWGD